jgi:hypothetical protein
MAICQWQSFKAAECWICQISLMVTLWCQAIWCYLMLLMLSVICLYICLVHPAFRVHKVAPCLASAVDCRRVIPMCSGRWHAAIGCHRPHRPHRPPGQSTRPVTSHSPRWIPGQPGDCERPLLASPRWQKNITKPFLPRPLGSLMKSSHVSHCFPKHLDNHSRTPSRRILFDSFTWFKHSRYHLNHLNIFKLQH